MENKLLEIVNSWESIIKNFKKRSDVISGKALGWKGSKSVASFENTPEGIGSGLGTTGWCVSASEALLFDDVFQTNLKYRGAKAKLISIDIKEQYYGHCYNGSQNKWHTAIFVEDAGFNFIIDITCRQFGNDFLEKDIWDFLTWQNKLRSPLCKHHITDFNNNPQKINPIISENPNNSIESLTKYNLNDITNITDSERNILSDFFLKNLNRINKNLLLKNINKIDYKYLTDVNKLLENLPFNTIKSGYSVLSFDSKESAKNWLELFLSNECKLPMYLLISNTVKDSCLKNYINFNELNTSNNLSVEKNKTFIVFEFDELFGIDTKWLANTTVVLPFGIELFIKKENIFNSGKLVDSPIIDKQTNTIIVKVEKMI